MCKKLIFFFLLSVLGFLMVNAQVTTDPCRKSTEGNDFWFGFMESRNYNNNHRLEFTVTAREATTFSVYTGNEETAFGTYSVGANSSVLVEIDWELVEAIGSENIENKGIHLVSEKPVNLYALNYDRNSADVAVIYPVESLGEEYFAMCYDVNISEYDDGSYRNGRNSEFLVVATEDSTEVLIIPSKVTDQLVPAGDSIQILLNKGEVYQVQSKNRNNLTGQGDLTQSYIKSSKPVAFFSGSLGTTVPAESGISAWDHLYEQIPPTQSWGREYYTVPLKTREQDRYRIMAAKDNTTITVTGDAPFVLDRGEFKEIVLYSNEPSRIYADKPIMVAQYSQSNKVDGTGDPFMIILSSVTQSKNDVTFVAYESDIITSYYVNIVTLTEEINNIYFGSSSIASYFKPFTDGNYSYAQITISGGSHRIYCTNEDRGFLAYDYGYGGVESYGYGVGFNLDLVLDLGENINFNGDTLALCEGSSITLDAGPYFDTYTWNTEDTTDVITVTEKGNYSVKTTTVDGCELEDSIYVYVSNPKGDLEIGPDYEDCALFEITLNAQEGFESYTWTDDADTIIGDSRYYTANKTGEYKVEVIDKYDCPASDTMNLVVYNTPIPTILGDSLYCGVKETTLNVTITDAPESEWDFDGSASWTSNKSEIRFINSTPQGTEISVTDWGEYTIYYALETVNDCVGYDTFKVAFQPIPTSDFVFVEDPDDKCKGYSREVKYTGNATSNATYYWDYGGAKLIDSMNWDNFLVSIGAFNTNPYISLFVEENGCWSDTTASLLGANPDFVLETGNERGCDSMSVLFRGELNVLDELLFEWDFGDGSAISNLQEVEHFYADTGFYDVSLVITNQLSGCQIGFEIDSMIKVFPTPTADITVDASVCYPDSAMLVFANSIDSSVCNWTFEGGHQLGSGNDSIVMVLDEPFATAILEVDEYGCVSEPAEVTLKRKPHFDFLATDTVGCQPLSIELSVAPQDSLLEFTWLNDSISNSSGNIISMFFPEFGSADVALAGYSTETGCVDTLVKKDWITIYPKPLASFEVDYPVALLEHATISYSNLSEYADYYNWDFGDGTTSIEGNPQHTFTDLGDYNTQLIAESVHECLDTTEFEIQILPFEVFTPNAFRPDSEIAENRTFMPLGVGADEERFNLKIFDRWGQVVFETNSPYDAWDGTTKNGKKAPMGNYVWISNYYDIQGYEHNQKGQVVLIRYF